jgi:putative MATE family efflux protein
MMAREANMSRTGMFKTEPGFARGDPQRIRAMGQDPIWRLLVRFSAPAIVSMVVASSYNIVDAIFVGRLGSAALAAMGVTFPLSMSLVAIATGTAIGATSLISRSLGKGDRESADRTAGVAISLCFLLSGLIALLCLPNLDAILRMLGARGAVVSLARSYSSVLIVFNLVSYLPLILGSLIRTDGNPVFVSSVSITSAILNIVLDPAFIFGFGPIPRLGIEGAAIATVISQGMSTLAFGAFILSTRTSYEFRLSHFLPRPTIAARIYRVGVASIVRSGAQFAVMGIINNTAASFGVVALAILGVLVRAGRFIQMPTIGLGQGMLPLLGYNYGAQNKARVGELVLMTALAGSAWTALCWLGIMLFPAYVMFLFNAEPEFLASGEQAVRLYSIACFTVGLRMVPGFFFQGVGKGLPATVLTAAQTAGFLLPAVLILSRLFGSAGLWVAFAVADCLGLLLGQLWMNREMKRQGISLFRWKFVIAAAIQKTRAAGIGTREE